MRFQQLVDKYWHEFRAASMRLTIVCLLASALLAAASRAQPLPKAPDEGSCPSVLAGPASVARVENQIPNGFPIVSMFASSVGW